jgi:gamma-glutamyltranspeptidase/glutathione hydrolase
LVGTFGMVSSTHWLASGAAMAMLERGGNAFDAAVAAGFVLQVAEPHLNGPGGDMPAILWSANEGRARVLCAQGVAPAAATIARYRDLGFDVMPGTGLLATVVPGAWDGWLTLLRDHGTLSLATVMAPALGYAEGGVPLVPRVVQTIAEMAPLFRDEWHGSAALWLPGGAPPAPLVPHPNPELAALWRRLLAGAATKPGREAAIDEARRLWSQGFVAETIDRFCRDFASLDSSGRRHHGLLTGQDMAEWAATWEEPARLDYHGLTLLKCGAWSQGPTFLQTLAILGGFDLDATDPEGDDFVHPLVEAMKLAFADRDGFLGDPAFVDVPLARLLSAEHAAARRASITELAAVDTPPGVIDGRAGWRDEGAAARAHRAPEFAAGGGTGEPTVRRDGATAGDTCHIAVVDRAGNMIACTPSGGWLQSSPAIPELGFCLNSRAQMFWLDPTAPGALGPRRRPRTTLTPSLALRGGEAHLAFGSPGGDQQEQWQLLMLLRHLHHGYTLQEAIEAPMLTSEHWTNSFWPRQARPLRLALESRFPQATMAALARRGHEVEAAPPWSLGRLCAVARDGRLLRAAANPRGQQGYAAGR